MAKITPETRIKNEKERLLRLFAGIDENKLETVQALIDRAAFMTVALEDLELELVKNGWVETYQHGKNQTGKKKSVAAEAHLSLTRNLTAIIKQLLELVPAAQKSDAISELAAMFE